jgi:uncharacterized membrane-anchored protein
MKYFGRPVTVLLIIVLEVILAILGFFSGISFLQDPSGGTHGMDTSILVTTPISDFTPVGLFFLVCYGILPSLAIYGLWKLPRWRWTDAFNKWTRENWAWTATVVIGVILIVWIAVEVALIGSPTGLPRFLQVSMAVLGVVFIALAMLPRVRTYAKSQVVASK